MGRSDVGYQHLALCSKMKFRSAASWATSSGAMLVQRAVLSLGDIQASQNFYYKDKTPPASPATMVLFQDHSRRLP